MDKAHANRSRMALACTSPVGKIYPDLSCLSLLSTGIRTLACLTLVGRPQQAAGGLQVLAALGKKMRFFCYLYLLFLYSNPY